MKVLLEMYNSYKFSQAFSNNHRAFIVKKSTVWTKYKNDFITCANM